MDEITATYYMYIIEYYSALKKSEILPFMTTWMGLKGVSEISQINANTI